MKPEKGAIVVSIIITLISLGVYLYLFGYADRKVIFLYEHLGLTPFSTMTIGRYWMAGFVLSGFLTIVYLLVRVIAKFILRSEEICWKSVVKFSFIPLIAGIVIIVTNFGEPRLTFLIAGSSAMALIIGLAIGLSVTDDLIKDFKSTIIYLTAGLGLVPFLILFRVLELPGKGILERNVSVVVAGFSMIGGFLWLLLIDRLVDQKPEWINVIKGTLATGYVGLPLLHYLVATPEGIPYITSSDNFFANNMVLRIATWLLLILMVFLSDKIIKRSALPLKNNPAV